MVEVKNNNKIFVQVDEDCDGYTSSAMLYLYIKALDPDYPIEYIMHSEPKMHGLANDEYLKIPKDTKLFIMADGGTNDAFEFNKLINSGIECIILDHHDANYQDESEEANEEVVEPYFELVPSTSKEDEYIFLEAKMNTNSVLEGNLYGLFTINSGARPASIEYLSNGNWIKFSNKFANFNIIKNDDKFVFRFVPRSENEFSYRLVIKEANDVLAKLEGVIN